MLYNSKWEQKIVLNIYNEEMKNILDLFLAGDRIVTDQYNELKAMIDQAA